MGYEDYPTDQIHWLTRIGMVPLSVSHLSDYQSSFDVVAHSASSICDFIQKFITGTGDDSYVNWPA